MSDRRTCIHKFKI